MTWAQTGAGAVATIRGGGARSSSAGLETKESDSMADLVGIQTTWCQSGSRGPQFLFSIGTTKTHYITLI